MQQRNATTKCNNESDMTGMRAAGRLATPGDENEHTHRA